MTRISRRDAVEGLGGVGVMALALISPFRRRQRNRWGMPSPDRGRAFPGDDLVASPAWQWTHGITVGAPADAVWPWVAQIGADRGGFYSYAGLENLVGCGVRNADRIHPEWQERQGTALVLHPKGPPLPIAVLETGHHLVAFGAPDEEARAAHRPWMAVSWLLMVEPLGASRARVVSRFRCAHSDDLRMRLAVGPGLLEPIGFAMDRRMLIGIRRRAEGRDAG